MKAFLLLCLLLMGCGGPVPVYLRSDTSRGGAVTDPTPEMREVLDEGFGYWGLEYELLETEDGTYGALEIRLTDIQFSEIARLNLPPSHRMGEHSQSGPCEHSIWSRYDSSTLAHELGHVWLGPKHEGGRQNLMNWQVGGDDLTDAQWDRAQMGIDFFMMCADGA